MSGAWWRRRSIRAIVTSERVRDLRHLSRIMIWLMPVFTIGAMTFLVPGAGLDQTSKDAVFLLAMASIAAIVGLVSRDVSTFLLDTGLLFEEFFERIAHLMVPAFAFFTFYSLLVIVFAAIYRIIDRFSTVPNFLIEGQIRDLTFTESLYFSLVTVSTVGYGDVVPESDLVRVVVSVQIMFGVLLLLFGFFEIMTYARDRGGPRDGS